MRCSLAMFLIILCVVACGAGLCAGPDVDGSGRVDSADLLTLLDAVEAGTPTLDVTGDLRMDHRDVESVALAWQSSASPTCRMRFQNGVVVVETATGARLLRMDPLFGITFTDWSMLDPSHMQAQIESQDPLVVHYTHARAEVWIRACAEPDRIVFSGEVLPKVGDVMHVALPHSFRLDGAPVRRMLWPRSLGVELLPPLLASNRTEQAEYPGADGFCDFVSADIGGVPIFFYRCEPEESPPAATFLLHCGAVPRFRRFYSAYIRQGERRALPAVACQVGGPLRETLLRYKHQCRLGRPLIEKLNAKFRERWPGMMRVIFVPPFSLMTECVGALPRPAVVEPWDWMFGGFDRKYPDFLPPNPNHGGEAGLRAFIAAAHAGGHFVMPYSNFTWWSTGWEGPDSEPAPSYVQYGDAALSRRLDGSLIFENYSGNYGYRNTPGHPLARQKRIEIRDALLDDYGVDLLYHDQLGARTWSFDANPALPNPDQYGAALMRIGHEESRFYPVGTEAGQDRVLEWASVLNYWTYPPLSPLLIWPNSSLDTYWTHAEARCFPYGLYLSSGDAILDVDSARTPEMTAWALALGARLSMLSVQRELFTGRTAERVRFLAELQRALARCVFERLLTVEYLAERVVATTWERHSVLANFSGTPWTRADGTVVAGSGFDLAREDGLRAGDYLDEAGRRVLLFVPPGSATAATLAEGAFSLRVGDAAMAAPVPVTHSVTGATVGILRYPISPGANFVGAQTVEKVVNAFAPLAPVEVDSTSLSGLRVRVNPYGEHLVVDDLAQWHEAVDGLRAWMEAGGIAVEIGGWTAWIMARWDGDGWSKRTQGPFALDALIDERLAFAPDTLTPLRVTALGETVLSKQTIAALEGSFARVLRPPLSTERALVLCESDAGAYLAVHPVGYGALVHVGGIPTEPAMAALVEAVEALLDGRLSTQPTWRIPVYREVAVER